MSKKKMLSLKNPKAEATLVKQFVSLFKAPVTGKIKTLFSAISLEGPVTPTSAALSQLVPKSALLPGASVKLLSALKEMLFSAHLLTSLGLNQFKPVPFPRSLLPWARYRQDEALLPWHRQCWGHGAGSQAEPSPLILEPGWLRGSGMAGRRTRRVQGEMVPPPRAHVMTARGPC